jgi:hypothetical protein
MKRTEGTVVHEQQQCTLLAQPSKPVYVKDAPLSHVQAKARVAEEPTAPFKPIPLKTTVPNAAAAKKTIAVYGSKHARTTKEHT